jgi:hypothetical protein
MRLRIKTTLDWYGWFDWIVIPSIMVGLRPYGIGIALLLLKIKAELIITWRQEYEKTDTDT